MKKLLVLIAVFSVLSSAVQVSALAWVDLGWQEVTRATGWTMDMFRAATEESKNGTPIATIRTYNGTGIFENISLAIGLRSVLGNKVVFKNWSRDFEKMTSTDDTVYYVEYDADQPTLSQIKEVGLQAVLVGGKYPPQGYGLIVKVSSVTREKVFTTTFNFEDRHKAYFQLGKDIGAWLLKELEVQKNVNEKKEQERAQAGSEAKN